MILVQRSMSWTCFLIHLVIFTWATQRLTQWAMSSRVIGYKKGSMLCTQSGGILLDFLQRTQQSNVGEILATGHMKILPFKKLRCDVMHVLLTGIEYFTQVTPNITNGINGFSWRCTRKAWHTRSFHQLTGAQDVKPFLRTNKL